jgi:hypothetical protein
MMVDVTGEDGVTEAEMAVCAAFSPECHGVLEWHHAVKQQRIKRAFPHGAIWGLSWHPATRYSPVTHGSPVTRTLDDILGDTRNRVWLCSRHHELVTNGRLEIELPESVWEFAADFGFTAGLENDEARRAA